MMNEFSLCQCQAIASGVTSIAEWETLCPSSLQQAKDNGWLQSCEAQMVKPKVWTFEACKADALRFKTRGEWRKNSRSAYTTAHRRKWAEECCKHMKAKPTIWTPELCKEDAKRYKTKTEWQKGSPSAYQAARRDGVIPYCCGHMPTDLRRKSLD